jgi:hypothetical protein
VPIREELLLLLLGEEGGTACVAGVFLVCASWALGVGQLMSADKLRRVGSVVGTRCWPAYER